MKIYILMEHYDKEYSHPVIATKSRDLAETIMKYRENINADSTWIEETEFDSRDIIELTF